MTTRIPRGERLTELVNARLAALTNQSAPVAPRHSLPPKEPHVQVAETPPAAPITPRFGWRHLLVVAAVLGAALVFTWWWVSQSKAQSIPVITASQPASAVVSEPASSVSTASGIYVHVLGEVKQPGVIELPAGARVQAAIEAAGGFTADADPADLNLAAEVCDGCQIVVGSRQDPAGEIRDGGGSGAGSSGGGGSAALVNLNQASSEELQTLPGVGPVTAESIISWRDKNGGFTSIEQLNEVDGIGEKTFAKLQPLVSV